jgi:hypothetical protein
VSQSSGRQRLNIHGAIDLETGKTRMIEAATVNAISTIMLLRAIEAVYPDKRLIHLFPDRLTSKGGHFNGLPAPARARVPRNRERRLDVVVVAFTGMVVWLDAEQAAEEGKAGTEGMWRMAPWIPRWA